MSSTKLDTTQVIHWRGECIKKTLYTIGSQPIRIRQLTISETLDINCHDEGLIVVSTPLSC